MIIHTVARLSFVNVQISIPITQWWKTLILFLRDSSINEFNPFWRYYRKKMSQTRDIELFWTFAAIQSLQTPPFFAPEIDSNFSIYQLIVINKKKLTNLSSDSLILRRIKNSTNLKLFVRDTYYDCKWHNWGIKNLVSPSSRLVK